MDNRTCNFPTMAEINFEAIEKALRNHRALYEKIEPPQNHESQKFINEAEKDLKDLKNGEPESKLVKLYNRINSQVKGRRGRIHKLQLFIYWQTLKMKNPKWENVDAVLEAIWDKNPGLIPVKDSDGFNFKYSSKIKSRYEKREEIGIVLNEILLEKTFDKDPESKKFKKDMEELIPSVIETIKLLGLDDPKKIKRNTKFREKVIDYLKTKKMATQRELSIKFSKKYADLFSILFHLIHKGMVGYDEKEKKFFFITEHPKSIESQGFSNRIIPVPGKS